MVETTSNDWVYLALKKKTLPCFSDELRPPNPGGQSQEFDDLESWNSSLVRWQTVAKFTLCYLT